LVLACADTYGFIIDFRLGEVRSLPLMFKIIVSY
jgi:hypothetical protein